jgi:TIR domain
MSVPINRIYISYRRTDTAAYAGRLFDHLSRHFGRGAVFMDIQGGITFGQDFTQAIDAALNTCDVALVLIGKHWATSTGPNDNLRLDDPNDWVRVETAAVLRRKILVIPVLVDGARLPDPASLPEELRPLCRRSVCEVTDPRWSYDVGELIKDIEKIAPQPERPKILTWILRKFSFYLNELKVLYLRNKASQWKIGAGAVIALAVLLGTGFFGLIPRQKERNTIELPVHPTGFAKEPNNGIYDATAILFGSSMKSKITKDDPIDWYVFKTSDDLEGEFLVDRAGKAVLDRDLPSAARRDVRRRRSRIGTNARDMDQLFHAARVRGGPRNSAPAEGDQRHHAVLKRHRSRLYMMPRSIRKMHNQPPACHRLVPRRARCA